MRLQVALDIVEVAGRSAQLLESAQQNMQIVLLQAAVVLWDDLLTCPRVESRLAMYKREHKACLGNEIFWVQSS
jgi:hypothetical protein